MSNDLRFRQMRGHVDHRLRPLISLEFMGHDDPVLAMVDTGFNGQLALSPLQALQLRVELTAFSGEVETANDRSSVRFGTSHIRWFGYFQRIEVLVFEERLTRRRNPLILLGAGLLQDRRLFINYGRRTLLIG